MKFKSSNLPSDCKSWDSVSVCTNINVRQPTSTHFHLLFFVMKQPHFWFIQYQFACLPAMILLLSPVHPAALLSPHHTPLTALTAATPTPWCRAVYAFTLSSLCWLLACCLFLFLLSVFSCTALHWGGPLHPLPIPVCFPAHSFALLSFCILHHHSSFSHLPSHSLAILDRLLWADAFQ